MQEKIALRIDDIGASTKRYEVYSKKWFGLGNLLFLKYLPYFRAWGVYREMTAEEWYAIFELLERYNAKLTVAVTATWVEHDGTRIPFPEKFPEEAHALKEGQDRGLIEIANHGLTHCVTQNNLFRPRLFTSNRTYHREFWEWVGEETHHMHIAEAQRILQEYFQTPITTLVPPGNVFCQYTLDAAQANGITAINCNTDDSTQNELAVLSNEHVFDFHDKEVVELGVSWLEEVLQKYTKHEHLFVRDLLTT